MELFRIVGCLHLSNRCPRDADFYIIGDFQNDRVAVNAIDGAVDARGGDDLIAVLHCAQHLLHFLALPLLRQNPQEIHYSEQEPEGNKKTAEPRDTAGLPEKKCCQIHVLNCSIPFRVFPHWAVRTTSARCPNRNERIPSSSSGVPASLPVRFSC